MSARCPCGAELRSLAAQAHGVCNDCRVEAKKQPSRRKPEPPPQDGLFAEPAHLDRRLVEVDGWPDYYSQGLL
jgi:hypothetical protein